MGSIFVSHASADNAEAVAIRDWLAHEGWSEIFLDFDPARGLAAGDRWQAALKNAAERCELVLFLVSPYWASSKWCIAEFLLAKQLNKRILAVIVKPTPQADIPVELTAEWQFADLTAGPLDTHLDVLVPPDDTKATVTFSQQGLARLKIGLRAAGLDPAFFPWPPDSDPDRSPYPGLRPLEAEGAGIYFGRDGQIASGLELIRSMCGADRAEAMVILGASGSGKSSFLRAGLLPRLARDDLHFVPLPVIRPERAAISGERGLVASLEGALRKSGRPRKRAEIRAAVAEGAAPVRDLLADVLDARAPPGEDSARQASVIVAVDQTEELFRADGAREAHAFLSLLRELASTERPHVIPVLAIRTDAYEQLQSAQPFDGIRPRLFDLPPMPAGAFGEIVRGPALRSTASGRSLRIDERLVDTLLTDMEAGGAKDALPLLAFTLEHLYREHGSSGTLDLSDYQALGGIRGAIEAAIEQVFDRADADPAIPKDKAARLALLRRAFIPWLAGIEPQTGNPRRRIARLSEIPSEARALVDLLVEHRLLATDRDADSGEVTIEPAHESLLRQWALLEGWLEEELPVLAGVEALRRATRDWAANGKRTEWLVHTGARLAEAEQAMARDDIAGLFEPTDLAYVAAARAQEADRRRAEISGLRRQRGLVAIAASILAVAAVGLWWAWTLTSRSLSETAASLGVVRSQAALRDGDLERAVAEAVAAMATLETVETRSAAMTALMELSPHLERTYDLGAERSAALAWKSADAVAVATDDGAIRNMSLAGGSISLAERWMLPDVASTLLPLDDGRMLAILPGGDLVVIGASAGTVPPTDELSAEDGFPGAVDATADGTLVVSVSMRDGLVLRKCPTGEIAEGRVECTRTRMEADYPSSVTLDAEGQRMAVGFENGSIEIREVYGGALLAAADAGARILSIDWSGAGPMLAVGTVAGDIKIFETTGDGLNLVHEERAYGLVSRLTWSPEGTAIAFVCDAVDVCILTAPQWANAPWSKSARLVASGTITGLHWSPDGARLATIDDRNSLRIWSRSENADVRRTLRTPVPAGLASIGFSRANGLIAAGDDAGRVWVWNGDGDLLHRLDPPDGVEGTVASIALSDGGKLAAAHRSLGVTIWRAEDGALLRTAPIAGARRVSFAGETAAAALSDGRIALLAEARGDPPGYLPAPSPALHPWSVLGTGDGRHLYASYTDGSIHVWDVPNQSHDRVLVSAAQAGPGADGAGSMSLGGDGRWLAATRNDDAVIVYDAEGEREPVRLDIDSMGTVAVAFSGSGSELAALGADGRLTVWSLADSRWSRILTVQPVPDRSEAGRLDTRQSRATALAWIGSDRLAVAGLAGEVHVLNMNTHAWRARAAGLGGGTAE